MTDTPAGSFFFLTGVIMPGARRRNQEAESRILKDVFELGCFRGGGRNRFLISL